MRKLLVIGLCLSMILGLCACGTKDTDKKTDSKKEDTKVESTVKNDENQTDEKETDESESESIQPENESVETEEGTAEEQWYEIVNESQMLAWDNVTVRGAGLQKDNGYGYEDEKVNNFTASINDSASKVMSTYPCGTYEDRVTFCKVDEHGYAKHSSHVEMYYDKDIDKIKMFTIDMYTSDEFYINDVQLHGLSKSEVKEKLGEPYAIIDGCLVWKYNDGYIMISFLMNASHVYVVNENYTESHETLHKFLEAQK